jgi:hypothetical protein
MALHAGEYPLQSVAILSVNPSCGPPCSPFPVHSVRVYVYAYASTHSHEYVCIVTRRMAHLTSKHFVHRDLAARNVLLDSKMRPKVHVTVRAHYQRSTYNFALYPRQLRRMQHTTAFASHIILHMLLQLTLHHHACACVLSHHHHHHHRFVTLDSDGALRVKTTIEYPTTQLCPFDGVILMR